MKISHRLRWNVFKGKAKRIQNRNDIHYSACGGLLDSVIQVNMNGQVKAENLKQSNVIEDDEGNLWSVISVSVGADEVAVKAVIRHLDRTYTWRFMPAELIRVHDLKC